MLATVVGSYPIPAWAKAQPSPEALRDALRVVLQIQAEAGIDVASDGEVTRWNFHEHRPSGMVERFVQHMEGISAAVSAAERIAYEGRLDARYRGAPPGVVRGVVGPGSLDLESEWRQAARLTARPLKFTVTSPYMMAKLLHDVCYGDFAQLLDALAGVLADQVARVAAAVVQIDEPNLPGSPQDALLAARAINRVLDRVSGEGAVHLCFGNFGGQRIQRGDYPSLLGFFNALHCRHLVLETTRRPAAELEILGEIRPEIGLGLGVIDVKDLQVETPEEVARRIERLAGAFGVERIRYVHPDCGLAHLPRDVADGKLRALVAGRDQFLGQRRSLDAALSGGR